jgi:TolA-binding protein
MRKDAIAQEALEKAMLIYSERGHKTVDEHSYSHPPTDYKRGTVEEPEHTSKLKMAFDEFMPAPSRNAEFNALAARDDQIEQEIEQLQNQMRVSRERGAFQQLQVQMQQVKDLIKEKEAIDAKMAVANLGAAQMKVYNDTMNQDDFSEMKEIGDQIAALEAKMVEFTESMKG